MASQPAFKVTFGGWYQRTTLHLSEIYEFMALGTSKLNLSKDQLAVYHTLLDLESVIREAGNFEYVKARTRSGIDIFYYEDGLYVLQHSSDDVKGSHQLLENYFNTVFTPGIAYIFSLGAPTPKILANIKTTHPTVVSLADRNPVGYKVDEKLYGQVYSKISSQGIVVYKTPQYIFIASKPGLEHTVAPLVEMQIFFREFKDQLEKYLNIHRNLWEEISAIKDRKVIKGNEVSEIRARLDSYQKTISLISNRINQMGSYIRTREALSKGLKIEQELATLFQFKFEVLMDTLDYIKEVWKMTTDYLGSAIQNVVEIKNQSAARGIQSLQLITSIGVVSGIIGYLSRNELPKVTAIGAFYFVVIILATWAVNAAITKIYARKQYKLAFTERLRDL